jgi:polysaccharide biosynthesis protein PslH
MNILFLCHRYPYPPDHGAKIRAYHLIDYLSRKHAVTVVTLAHRENEVTQGAGLKVCCEDLIAEILPSSVRWSNAINALCYSAPSSVAYFWSAKLKRRIDQKLKDTKFDAIIVFCAFMAQYVLDSDVAFRFLDYGDLDSGKWAEYARHKPFPLSMGYAIEAVKLRKYERKIAQHFHHCAVVSQGELEEFNSFNITVPCTIIPNGVDTTYFNANSDDQRPSPVIAFLGRMDYFPNVDGIIYFAEEIFPKIREKQADAQLRIIGSNPLASVRRLTKLGNIFVTGEVADVRPYLRDVTVSVVPLRIARGTQNKILESMAMGIPVVTTSIAARGVQCVPDDHLLVANGPDDFAEKVIEVFHSISLRKKLSEGGRQHVEKAYSWDCSMGILEDILNKNLQ